MLIPELLYEVCYYLNISDLFSMIQVNHYFYEICADFIDVINKKLRKYIRENKGLDYTLYNVCRKKYKLQKYFIELLLVYGAQPVHGLYGSCYSGNMKLVEKFIDLIPNSLDIVNVYGKGIYHASTNRQIDIIINLISLGGHPGWGATGAARKGYKRLTKMMLGLIRNDASKRYWLHETLSSACEGGYLKLAKYLINEGVNDLTDAIGKSAISGNIKLVKFLIEKQKVLQPNARIRLGKVLSYACRMGHVDIVRYIAKICQEDSFDNSDDEEELDRHMILSRYDERILAKSSEIIGLLSEIFGDTEYKLDYDETFYTACYNNSTKLIRKLMNHNVSINNGLVGAVSGGNIDVIKMLINKGATSFTCALDMACKNGYIEIVKLLMEQEIKECYWPLHTACREGRYEIVNYFLNSDIDLTRFKFSYPFNKHRYNGKIIGILAKHDIV